ncbi:glycoside hydrolase family 78 protein [Flavobacterium sp. 3-218]
MKNSIYLSIICLVFAACGSGGGDDPVTPTPVNTAPTAPVLTTPADNKLCLDNNVSFQWNASTDEQKDAIVYQIQIAKDNAFAQIINTLDNSSLSTSALALEKNTAYYWRVKATDAKGLASAYSSTFKFYTAGTAVVNHLPFAPELVSPVLNSAIGTSSANLTWKASDVDTADILTYDVYFGTANPPTAKVSENTSSKSFEVALQSTTQYYWRIVVKDNKGGETVGQVWKFKTN